MPITFRKTGPALSRDLKPRIGAAIKHTYQPLGDRLVSALKSEAPEDTGKFKKSIRFRITGSALKTTLRVYATSTDAEWAEEGREPGKAPPPDVMLRLVRRRGIGASAFSKKTGRQIAAGTRRIRSRETGKLRTRAQSLLVIQKSIAFLIGRAIARRGTKGSHIFADLKSKHAGEISRAIATMRVNVARVLNK